MQAQFTVAGDPKGKQRPRTVHTSKGIKTYTPDQTVVYENYIEGREEFYEIARRYR